MLDEIYQFKQLQKKTIEQLQLFSINYGQYPHSNLYINTEVIFLLSLLKEQKKPIHHPLNSLSIFYWQYKKQSKNIASFSTIDTFHHIFKARGDSFYLVRLAFQQQDKQSDAFPATLFILTRTVFEQQSEQSQIIFHFNNTNSRQQNIDTVQSLNTPRPLYPFNDLFLTRQDSSNETQYTDLVEINVWGLMLLWQQVSTNSLHYVLQLLAVCNLRSHSPKRLYDRKQQVVTTEVFAGKVKQSMYQ